MKKTKLYVGNLSYDCSDQDLFDHFEQAGDVAEASVVLDKFTGRSRGFAFVTYNNPEDAEKAVSMFAEQEFMDRKLIVNEAMDSSSKPRREFSGKPRGGGGGGGFRDRGNRGGGRDRR